MALPLGQGPLSAPHAPLAPRGPAPHAPAPVDPGDVLAWGAPRLRDLPWRATREPWPILVAEIMLQQTQARRVIPKWLAFCEEYPTPAACAAAPLGSVLRAWQGLGYPRRARNLHDAASAVVSRHGGRVPDDLDALQALPGIGPYTARAVLAFAFERDVAVVDTNIARILARVAGERLTARRVQQAADALVPAGSGWAWNQMLMDLGATVCRPTPRCAECPLARSCAWHAGGHAQPDPAAGSAGVSTRQAPYAGSDRAARGEVLRALHDGPRPAAGFDARIVEGLVADRLVVRSGADLDLP
jgi:A/G-specific adenine glycosylase